MKVVGGEERKTVGQRIDERRRMQLFDQMALEGVRLFGHEMIATAAALPSMQTEEMMQGLMKLVWASAYGFAKVGLEVREYALTTLDKKEEKEEVADELQD